MSDPPALRFVVWCPLLGAALVSPLAHAGRSRVPPPEFVPPTTNFYLRAAFDTDPSVYLGRFMPDGEGAPDEAMARKTACSQHLSVREVGGGGVEYDEIFESSRGVALGLGVPGTDLKLGGGGGPIRQPARELHADLQDDRRHR